MPSMTYSADGHAVARLSRARPANCAHLHSAFGPGCPYCRQPADAGAGRLRRAQRPLTAAGPGKGALATADAG